MAKKQRIRDWLTDKYSKLEPRRSWITLIGVTTTNIILTMGDNSFAVIYDDLIEKFDSNRSSVGWAPSLFWIFIFLSMIFVRPFIEMYGVRPVALIGISTFAISNTFSSYCTNLVAFHFLYGVFPGIGVVSTYLCGVITLQHTFNENRNLATVISSLGFTIGAIIHPIHSKYFMDEFGVSGALLIMSGISFNGIISALALKLPSEVLRNDAKSAKNSSEKEISRISTGIVAPIPESEPTMIYNDKESVDKPSKNTVICTNIRKYFRNLIDFSPMKNTPFALAIVYVALSWMVKLGLSAHIISCAKFRGISDDDAAYLFTIYGFAEFTAVIVTSFLVNMACVQTPVVFGFASCLFVATAFSLAFSFTHTMFVTASIFLGLAAGVVTSNVPVLVVYITGVEGFPKGMALLWTLSVPGPIGAAPLVGWLVDRSGHYFVPFVVLGVVSILSVILVTVLFILMRRKQLGSAKHCCL